ncbi:altronate dehydratase family protein [Reichenbachiella carrageenanivorans]|uniref:Altronate dehydratase family protein n=1 Tax=Reichenbachiella carrageenanivorans TaxID=2979869 RepID=A0ABY6D579_9BACT|nr:altronate dehydratase family protein [Reichenbachiella carrageenanivorans]UXX81316.1 altronate dehydratase family protein [Reichenbachiella carrageenanivorans]
MKKAITINESDNLGVALTDLQTGATISINGAEVSLKQDIQAKHKFALHDLAIGDEMYMYGLVVGTAKVAILAGQAITVENTAHKATSFTDQATSDFQWAAPDVSRFEQRTFDGYHRADGQVGTDNVWLVFPLVFCENRNILTIKKAFEKALGYEDSNAYNDFASTLVDQYKNGASFDEIKLETAIKAEKKELFENVKVKFITHQAGCGGTREDSDTLCRLLAGYLKNPNVAGATVLSLGCQNAQVSILQSAIADTSGTLTKPLLIFDQQETGKESDLIENAIKDTFKGLIEANKITRQPAPLSKLTIGLECGGSDGFSGISANPALGHVSDMITALGGKAILSEFPELCGVEQELINRTKDPAHAKKFISLMRAYAKSAEDVGSGFDMNPSPGNIKDGLITDAMKSAGAAKKGGTSPVVDVLDYTEYANNNGLSLLCTPGNDVESTTGLVGSGANVVLFTTGLGTPTGNPIAPILKVSSNTKLAEHMPDIIDINAGVVIEGKKTIAEMGEEMLNQIIQIASGQVAAKAVLMNQEDFIPWKRGVSL